MLPWSAIAFAGADASAAMTALIRVATQPGDPVPKSVAVEPSSGAVTVVVRDAPVTITAISGDQQPGAGQAPPRPRAAAAGLPPQRHRQRRRP